MCMASSHLGADSSTYVAVALHEPLLQRAQDGLHGQRAAEVHQVQHSRGVGHTEAGTVVEALSLLASLPRPTDLACTTLDPAGRGRELGVPSELLHPAAKLEGKRHEKRFLITTTSCSNRSPLLHSRTRLRTITRRWEESGWEPCRLWSVLSTWSRDWRRVYWEATLGNPINSTVFCLSCIAALHKAQLWLSLGQPCSECACSQSHPIFDFTCIRVPIITLFIHG